MKLLTMTPIHIGNGEIANQLSYIHDKNSIYLINFDNFFNNLTDLQCEAYIQWIDHLINRKKEIDEKIKSLNKNKKLERSIQNQKRDLEKQLSIGLFIQNRLSQNPIDFAKKFIDYKISYSSLPGREGFRLHIKNADKKPYIPATEIKGAIRTSLLYTMLSDKTYYEILKKSLEKKELNTIASEIQRKFFRGKENDAKYDLFKFIKISDTNSISTNHLKIVNVAVLGSSRNIKIWLETINPKNEFDFSLVIHENKYLEELGLEILKGYLSIDKLLYACYHRSKEILEEEERFFTGHNKILDVINKLKKANLPDSPLLRLGAGQGFLGTTIGLKVKKNDPSLYDEVLRAGISSLRRWKTQRNNFPKTRRVLIDDKGLAIDILGWVKLIP